MKSRVSLVSFASLFVLSSLTFLACQEDTPSSPPTNPGNGGTSSGGAGGSNNNGGTKPNAGNNTGGTGNAGTNGGDPCGGTETTIAELNKAKAPLPETRQRLKGIVATSHKVLVSNSASGCLWGVYVTTAGSTVSEYGSIQVVSKGEPPLTDQDGKKTCKTGAESGDQIPNDIKPGDVFDVSGFADEFLLGNCGKPSSQDPNVIEPKPEAGQRQFKDSSCFQITSSGAVPAAHTFSDLTTITAIAKGLNTDDALYKWGGALVKITAPLTTKQLDPSSGNKYFNCSAVSGFGDLNFNEVPELTVNNSAYYNDVTCTGPKDSAKRYDFQQPTTFTSVAGIVSLNFCTWELSAQTRCDNFEPRSPSCDLAPECQKAIGATKCDGTEDTAALCSDGMDNDGNSFTDCEDKGCCALVDCKTIAPTSYCGKGGGAGGSSGSGENTAALCGDGTDNDGDNFADCEDKECCSLVDCSGKVGSYCEKQENTAAKCQDGADNDGDKFTDCEDSGCCAVVDCKTTAPTSFCGKQGSGGAGGSSGGAENTPELCSDGVNNDGDNFIDCEDKDCCPVVDCKTTAPTSYCAKQGGAGGAGGGENTAALCSDKMDNDGDKFIDCEDSGCCAVVDCKAIAPTSFCGKKGVENTAALCGDTMDNDGDGFIDCNDKDCCALITDCKVKDPNSYCGKM